MPTPRPHVPEPRGPDAVSWAFVVDPDERPVFADPAAAVLASSALVAEDPPLAFQVADRAYVCRRWTVPDAAHAAGDGTAAVHYVAALDGDLTLLRADPGVIDLCGRSARECAEDPSLWARAIDPADWASVAEAVARCRDTGENLVAEYRVTRPDGTTSWIRDRARAVRDADGRPTLLAGTRTEITRERRLGRLLALQAELAVALGSAGPFDDTLAVALDRILRATGSAAGAIFLLDAGGDLAPRVQRGWASDALALAALHPPRDAEAVAILASLPATADEPRARAVFPPGFTCGLAVPLVHGNDAIGCLAIAWDAGAAVPDLPIALEAGAAQLAAAVVSARARDDLRASETEHRHVSQLLRELCDNVPDFIWAKDLKGRYLFANRATRERLLGARTATEPLGRTDRYFADRERQRRPDHPAWYTFDEVSAASDRAVVDANGPRRFDEYGHALGEFLYLDVWKAPLRDPFGRVVGTVGCARDVLREREYEQESRRAADQMRALIRAIPVMVLAFDRDGRCVAWNSECERVTGWCAADVAARERALDVLAPPGEPTPPELWDLQRPVAPFRDRECEIVTRSGARRVIAWSNLSRDLPVAGWHAWSIGVDVTERIDAEQQRNLALARQQQLQKEQTLVALAENVANDFNNMLTVVLAHAELARFETAEGPIATHVDAIGAAARRAVELCANLQAYAGRAKLCPERTRLGAIVVEAVRSEPGLTRSCGIEIDHPPRQEEDEVEADVFAARQLVLALLRNAVEAAPPGSTIRVRTGTTACSREDLDACVFGDRAQAGPFAFIEVEDRGPGIPEGFERRVFDPFFSTKRRGGGLGLPAAAGIVRAHGGAIRIDSRPGRGTTVRVLLPLAGGAPGHAAGSNEQEWRFFGTVLVLESDFEQRRVLRRMIERHGGRALVASTVAEAIDLCATAGDSIAAAILDGSGAAHADRTLLHALRVHAPRAMLFVAGDAAGQFPADKVAGFLPKPITLQALIAALKPLGTN